VVLYRKAIVEKLKMMCPVREERRETFEIDRQHLPSKVIMIKTTAYRLTASRALRYRKEDSHLEVMI
jgi:hypothetical protein